MPRWIFVVLAFLPLGCAGVTVKPLPSDPAEEKKLGDYGIAISGMRRFS